MNGTTVGDDTRGALLDAGRRLFARRGFDGTSVRDLTREAGTNLGAVNYHFGSKRGLYEAVLEAGLSPLAARIEAVAEGPGSPPERLDALIDALFDHLAGHPELPRLLLQEVTAGKPPPDVVVSIIRRNVANVGRILEAGWADGSVRRGHPLLSALSIVSQPIYVSLIAPLIKEVGGLDLQDPETRAVVARHAKTFVRAGLEPRRESHA